jgi:peroxiredoxin Q/BCP
VAHFAASTDAPETNRRFAESLGLDYPILSDPGGAVARAYGVYSEERGIALRRTFYIGADGTVLHVDRDVSPATAGADVAARLERLGVSRRAGASR